MAAPDNDADNLRGVYSGYDDPTGVPTPKGRPAGGDSIGIRTLPATDHAALGMDEQGDVLYVTTGEAPA